MCYDGLRRLQAEIRSVRDSVSWTQSQQAVTQRAGHDALSEMLDDVSRLTDRVQETEWQLLGDVAQARRVADGAKADADSAVLLAKAVEQKLDDFRTRLTNGAVPGSSRDMPPHDRALVTPDGSDERAPRARFDTRTSADRAFPPRETDSSTFDSPTAPRPGTTSVPLSALRSRAERTYDVRNDPLASTDIAARGFEDAEDVSDKRLEKLKLPDARDFPIFEGKAKSPSTVASRLRTWIDSVDLFIAARSVPAVVVRSYLPTMLKNDALEMLKAMSHEREGGLKAFTFLEIVQRMLHRYVTESQIAEQERALKYWSYPDRSYSDAGVWAAAFLDACRHVHGQDLDVARFLSLMTNTVALAITRKLRKLCREERWTDVGQVVLGFEAIITEVREEADLHRDLGRERAGHQAHSRFPGKEDNQVRRDRFPVRTAGKPGASSDLSNTAHKVRAYAAEIQKLEEVRACWGCGRKGHIRRNCDDPQVEQRHGRTAAIVMACAAFGIQPADESDADTAPSNEPEEPLDELELDDDRGLNLGAIVGAIGSSDETSAEAPSSSIPIGVILFDEEPLDVGRTEIGRKPPSPSLSFDDARSEALQLMHSRGRDRKTVLPIPREYITECVRRAGDQEARVFIDTEPGKMHLEGKAWTIPFCVMGQEGSPLLGLIDTGAQPTLCKASALAKVFPDYKRRLTPFKRTLQGLSGAASAVLGLFSTTIIFPHWEQSVFLPRVEFIVAEYDLAYDFILGQDLSAVYGFTLARPQLAPPYLKIGTHPQQFHIGQAAPLPMTLRIKDKPKESDQKRLPAAPATTDPPASNTVTAAFDPLKTSDLFPSERDDIRHEGFLAVLSQPRAGSAKFHLALEKANISTTLTAEQKTQLLLVLSAAEGAFALDGEVYERPHLGEPLHLEIVMPNPAPKNVKRGYYPCSDKARKDMEKANSKQLAEGVCVRSTSPYAAATFMIYRSTDGGEPKPRMVHDYRFMNMLLKVPAYPIPHIWTSLSTVQRSTYMTSVDIVSAFHCMWLTEDSRQYTAYSTPFGLFEYLTGCFGIASMPSEFQMRIEALFASPIWQRWLLVYIDDGLIASETWEAHLWQLYIVLSILAISGCRVALKKCHFAVPEVKYLGHKLTGLTLSLDEGRVLAIKAWEAPVHRKGVQELLGFLNYHRNFIKGFSTIVRPLQALVPVSVPFVWGPEQAAAFEASKQAMIDAVTLFKPDFSDQAKPFIVYTDASFTGLGAALYQTQNIHGESREVPICFISRKLGDTEHRYAATQLECLCVVWMLEKLHFYLHGATFTIVTDCDALKTLLTARWVNRHMIRWQVGIQDYHGKFEIVHRAGTAHSNADGPSRNPLPNDPSNPACDLRRVISVGGITFYQTPKSVNPNPFYPQPRTAASFEESGDGSTNVIASPAEMDKHDVIGVEAGWAELDRMHVPLPKGAVALANIALCPRPMKVGATMTAAVAQDTQETIIAGYKASPEGRALLQALQKQDRSLLHPDSHVSIKSAMAKRQLYLLGDIIYFSEFGPSGAAAYVADSPTRLQLLDVCHDELMAGHFGPDKTFERLRTFCWWPGMREECIAYCNSCEPCSKAKARTGRPFGLLQYIEAPTEPWAVVNMDFVTALPPAGLLSYDSVLVVKCRLTRRTRLIPCWKTIDAPGVAALFAAHIVCQHGLPSTIISDRDPKFTSDFWKNLTSALGVKLAMTTAHNPQADGLAEREIKSLEESLRLFVNFGTLQEGRNIKRDWVDALPFYEYAYNSSRHASTGEVPFEVDIGRVPRNTMDGLVELLGRAPSASTRGVRGYARFAVALQKRAEAAAKLAFEAAKRRYDGGHRESPIKAGEFVLLSTKHFNFSDTYNKLKSAWMGPYEVLKLVGPNAAQLDLPPPLDRRHPVFSVRYMKPCAAPKTGSRFQGRREYLSVRPKVGLAGETYNSSEVERVLDSRVIRNPEGNLVQQVLIRWKGYGLDSDVWVSTSQFNEKTDPTWARMLRDYRAAVRAEGPALANLNPSEDTTSGLVGLPSVQDDLATPDDDVYEVEKIVAQRPSNSGIPGSVEYRVRWTGFGPSDDTYLSAHELRGAPEALQAWRDQVVQSVVRKQTTRRSSRRALTNPTTKTIPNTRSAGIKS